MVLIGQKSLGSSYDSAHSILARKHSNFNDFGKNLRNEITVFYIFMTRLKKLINILEKMITEFRKFQKSILMNCMQEETLLKFSNYQKLLIS